MDEQLYKGPAVGCVYCAYECSRTGDIDDVPRAMVVVNHGKGPREVCRNHALRGRWSARTRRVSVVA